MAVTTNLSTWISGTGWETRVLCAWTPVIKVLNVSLVGADGSFHDTGNGYES